METNILVNKCEYFLHTMGEDVSPTAAIALTNCYTNRLTLKCTYPETIEHQLDLIHEICTETPWWFDLLE